MTGRFLSVLFALSRAQKRGTQVVADTFALLLSFVLAMVLRLESLEFASDQRVWLAIGFVICCSIGIFHAFRLYEAMVRYISANAIVAIILGILASGFLLFLTNMALGQVIPRTVPAIYCAFAFPLVTGSRFGFRALFNRHLNTRKENVIIYGAGSAGRQLLRTLQQDPAFNPVAFLDDDTQLQNVSVSGLRVYAPECLESLSEKFEARRVLLAIPSAGPRDRRSILARLSGMQVQVQTIPGISEIMSGKAQINDLRNVAVEELLGRDPVPPLENLLDANLRGKAVMVTGAGGSIGSELCRQAVMRGLRRLVLVDTSEFALYSIDAELRRLLAESGADLDIIPLLLSVQSLDAMTVAMTTFGIETVYHTAAYKHVPLVEHNVVESMRNNVFGTLTTAKAAVAAGVRSFILVSTDKAVRPTNYMGASKRVAELICQALAEQQKQTVFAMVRFGNVLGSSGSVIPHFRQQIESGGPVTVTHPEVTRYFMTIPEAALLVLQAAAMARGGDVFVLDMGEPVAIVDLAARMISLSGLTPVFEDQDHRPAQPGEIAIRFTKLRAGEKLYEELLIGDDVTPTQHPRILSAREEMLPWQALHALLMDLQVACDALDIPRIRALLTTAVPGFQSSEDIVDYGWSGTVAALTAADGLRQEMSAAE